MSLSQTRASRTLRHHRSAHSKSIRVPSHTKMRSAPALKNLLPTMGGSLYAPLDNRIDNRRQRPWAKIILIGVVLLFFVWVVSPSSYTSRLHAETLISRSF